MGYDPMLAAARQMYRQFEARRTRRVQVFIPATLVIAGRSFPAHMLDLSTDGALIHVEDELPVGEKIWLLRNGLDVFARIAWGRGTRFGLAFEKPLRSEQYEGLLQARDNRLMLAGTA